MSIIDSNYLKSIPIPIKDSQWDSIGEEQIQAAIDESEEYIVDYLDRHIASDYFTDTFFGRGRPSHVLEEYPIDHIASVYWYDAYGNQYEHDVEDFIIYADAGIIEWKNRAENTFYSDRKYMVNYQAGFYPVPAPIKKAIAYQTIEALQPIFRKTNSAMSMVDLIPNSTEVIVEYLEKYRRKRIG